MFNSKPQCYRLNSRKWEVLARTPGPSVPSMASAESSKVWKMVSPGEFRPRRMPLHDLTTPREAEVHLWYLDLGHLSLSLRGSPEENRQVVHELKVLMKAYIRTFTREEEAQIEA